jgi:hypothetical protein
VVFVLRLTLAFPKCVYQFVTQSPNSSQLLLSTVLPRLRSLKFHTHHVVYLFDAPHRGAKIAELCRSSGVAGRKNDCISVAIESRHLFEYMQKLGSVFPSPPPPSNIDLDSIQNLKRHKLYNLTVEFCFAIVFFVSCHSTHQGRKSVGILFLLFILLE